ncbi:MAG: hypothetical protein SF123_24940 [Chloroflexota bacterium]|nr:hypothetical protein [Chloroflexota bacterium]
MPAFALYYVPDADTPFYTAGAQILGYDVWTGEFLSTDNPARTCFESFDAAWPAEAQTFGFHMTITHALEFDSERLPEIEREIIAILNLFDLVAPFTLQPTDAWLRCDERDVVLYYHPNQAFMMFHAVCVARLHPFGRSSPAYQRYLAGELSHLRPAEQQRTRQYLHPDILENWFPHLALLRHHTGLSTEATRTGVLKALPPPTPLTVERVCLLVRPDNETHYRVHRVFDRVDFPSGE